MFRWFYQQVIVTDHMTRVAPTFDQSEASKHELLSEARDIPGGVTVMTSTKTIIDFRNQIQGPTEVKDEEIYKIIYLYTKTDAIILTTLTLFFILVIHKKFLKCMNNYKSLVTATQYSPTKTWKSFVLIMEENLPIDELEMR